MQADILLLLGLATWRTSSLLVHEEGPFRVFTRLREAAGIVHDDQGNIAMIPDRLLAGILSCIWCCSIWIGFGWLLFWTIFPDSAIMIGSAFAVSAIAIFAEKVAR